ncbi:unnamed protein product [Schistosoma intercalatum]|nr:unnamed protein product [Schistosoma intercalatum]CAH8598335.1 unnamed protein product [Schistosoma intercalatum]
MIKCNQDIEMRKLRLQSLDIEFCLPLGDSFCTELVPNSFCSIEKNECFCKYGYYSIQEDDGIVCKTLLTNDKCQLDSDCIYVKNSICHPGAGACICPSGTIYVPEEQSCRFQIKTFTNDFCDKCERFHGLCYRYENDRELSHNNQRILYGCKCPYNTVSINTNLLWNKSYINQSKTSISINSTQIINYMSDKENSVFCRGLLVDIGMFCNQIDMLCRSSNAFCSNGKVINNIYLSPQCICQDGYLPVYQEYLDYYECNLSSTQQNITICFNLSMEHQSSIFIKNDTTHLIVFISNQLNSPYPYDSCLLSMFREGIWCKTLNYSKNYDILTRCASIQIHHKKKEITFKAFVIVLYQSAFDFIIRDIQYFILFTSYWNEDYITIDSTDIKMIHGNYTTRNQSKILDKIHQNLKFKIQNDLNKKYARNVIDTRESMHLHVEYYYQNNSYTYISIEQCSISQTSPYAKSDEIIIVHKNCLLYSPEVINEIKFHSNHLSTYGNFAIPLNKYTSVSSMKLLTNITEANSFQLNSNVMGFYSNASFTATSELHINCIFRVCQHIRWCVWPSYCNDHMRSLDYDVHQSDLSESDMFPSILMLTKSLKIKISNYNSISPSPYSSPYSPVFIQNKSINSVCQSDNIFIKFPTHFIIFIICLISGISFITFYYQCNSLICQTPYSRCCCQSFYRSNHEKYNGNPLITYNLCNNPLITKALQSIIDENDNKHYSMNNMLKDQSQQGYHCSQMRCIQSDCSLKTEHDRFHNQEDNLYHHNTLKEINIRNCDDNDNDVDDDHTIWDEIIPVCYEMNSNSNIIEIYKNRLSSLCHSQEKNILVPCCLHNQNLYFHQSYWDNNTIDKPETTYKSISSTDYICYNRNFDDLTNIVTVKNDLSSDNHDEQIFNV